MNRLRQHETTQYEGRTPKRVRTIDNSICEAPESEENDELGWSPFRIIRIMESYKTVGKGYIEVARYEILFGFNHKGSNFKNGEYIGSELDFETYLDLFITQAIRDFDGEIEAIEKASNKIFSCRWILLKNTTCPDQSCLQNSFAATSCEDFALGDYNLPTCNFCVVKVEIDTWYKQLTKTVGTHADPRLPLRNINWNLFSKRISFIFKSIKDKDIARNTDWTKLAFITRAYLMYLLSVKLTQDLLRTVIILMHVLTSYEL